ncbi:MAG: hypothetical protein HY016_09575 [Nitrosomonadales bacterium]|nr:hypothetical protein [Nitrosomonadales bacterium]
MNTADILIHVHPELDERARIDLANKVTGCVGVDCAEFDHHTHPHALIVKYDPDTVQSMRILDMVRRVDPIATMVGL